MQTSSGNIRIVIDPRVPRAWIHGTEILYDQADAIAEAWAHCSFADLAIRLRPYCGGEDWAGPCYQLAKFARPQIPHQPR